MSIPFLGFVKPMLRRLASPLFLSEQYYPSPIPQWGPFRRFLWWTYNRLRVWLAQWVASGYLKYMIKHEHAKRVNLKSTYIF